MTEQNTSKTTPKPTSRHEWTEWHLTPHGWESGSTRTTEAGTVWRDEPQDRLLSFVYRERSPAGGQAAAGSAEESWRTKDPAKLDTIDESLERFGECPQRLTPNG
jgi:hypothetical protein